VAPGKRPGTQSDEDRALAELQRRRVATPVGGVPVDEFEGDHRTPPPADIEELIHRLWPLRKMGDDITEVSTKVTRLEVRADGLEKMAGGLSEIGEHVAADAAVHTEIVAKLTDIHGRSGDNGKLGELRRRVDALSKAAWLVVSVAVGGIGAAAVKLIMVVRAFDAVEARGEATSARQLELIDRVLRLETEALRRHRHIPAEAPDRKDTP
jgi:hypothetical protein